MAERTCLEVKPVRYIEFPERKELLAKYNDSIAKYGDKAKSVLSKFALADNGYILGSNPFMAVQLGNLDGVRLALPAELEEAVRLNPDFFRGKYEDIAIVLRSEGDSYLANDFIAKNLAEQVKKKLGSMPTPEHPARISLKGLDLKEDGNSDYGLVFVLKDEAEVISVPEFAYVNDRRRFSKTDERGVPIFDSNGNRRLYIRESGLSGFCLNWGLGLGSDGGNLAYSNSGGRVPLVSSEAGIAKNSGFNKYLALLKQVRAGEAPNSALEELIKELERNTE